MTLAQEPSGVQEIPLGKIGAELKFGRHIELKGPVLHDIGERDA